MFLSFPATFLGLHVSLWAQKQLHKTPLPRASHPCYLTLFFKGVQKFFASPPQNPNQVQALPGPHPATHQTPISPNRRSAGGVYIHLSVAAFTSYRA